MVLFFFMTHSERPTPLDQKRRDLVLQTSQLFGLGLTAGFVGASVLLDNMQQDQGSKPADTISEKEQNEKRAIDLFLRDLNAIVKGGAATLTWKEVYDNNLLPTLLDLSTLYVRAYASTQINEAIEHEAYTVFAPYAPLAFIAALREAVKDRSIDTRTLEILIFWAEKGIPRPTLPRRENTEKPMKPAMDA